MNEKISLNALWIMFSDPMDFFVNNTFAPLNGKPIKL